MTNYTGETIGMVSMLISVAYLVSILAMDKTGGGASMWWSIVTLVLLIVGMIALGIGMANKSKRHR